MAYLRFATVYRGFEPVADFEYDPGRNRQPGHHNQSPGGPTVNIPTHDRLTMSEATAYAGCSERTLRRYVSDGLLPAYRIGPRRLAFRISDLDALATRVPTAGDAV